MRYNENDGNEINGKIVITSDIDDNPIFEISCIVVGDLSVDTIKANYDLVVIGNVSAERIEINGNFTCIGECECEEIAIQGDCTIDGNLNVSEGFIGDFLIAHEICIESLEIKGSVICTNLECNDEVECEKYVLVAEGLTGSGSLMSSMALCGEYSMIEDTNGVFIADSMQMEKTVSDKTPDDNSSNDINELIKKAQKISLQKFSKELEAFVENNDRYKNELSALKKIQMAENMTIVPNMRFYVDMIDTLNKKYMIISHLDAFEKVKKKYENYTYDDVNQSVMTPISQKEFAKMLYVLFHRGQLFKDDIRELIIETLYTYVGIEEETFQDNKKKDNNVEVSSKKKEEKAQDKKSEITSSPKEDDKRSFIPGDLIIITSGAWKNTYGKVKSVNNKSGKVDVIVDLFGRGTVITIPISQIEK